MNLLLSLLEVALLFACFLGLAALAERAWRRRRQRREGSLPECGIVRGSDGHPIE